ncbi:MAG: tRNA lysidine(34) synthetase TilS [Gemmatimonadota bacterium]
MPDGMSTLRRNAPAPPGESADRRASASVRADGRECSRDSGLASRLTAHLRGSGLLASGQTVVVAVSGGLDSMVLLHALRFPLRAWRLTLVAAHFDHAMRPDSAADAAWLTGVCRAWDVPLERARAARRLRSEAEARSAWYRFLERVGDAHAADRVATAHHADDQAETVLFRAARGTGLRGLAGIPPQRDRIVRPLLPFRRRAIAAYADAAGLRWRDDPTNRSDAYARNRLRHEVLPRLEAVAPGATDALVRLADRARAVEAAWQSALEPVAADVVAEARDDGIVLARPRFLAYHPYVQARLLRRTLGRFASRPDRAGTRAALAFIRSGASGGRFHVQGGVVIEREFDRIRVRPACASERPNRSLLIDAPSSGSGRVLVGGRTFRVRWWSEDAAGHDGADAAFDPEVLRFPLELREWRPGDRLRLPYGTKKLKKLFGERRIGRSERGRLPVLVDAAGRVLWVVGVARAADAEAGPGRPAFRVSVNDA